MVSPTCLHGQRQLVHLHKRLAARDQRGKIQKDTRFRTTEITRTDLEMILQLLHVPADKAHIVLKDPIEPQAPKKEATNKPFISRVGLKEQGRSIRA